MTDKARVGFVLLVSIVVSLGASGLAGAAPVVVLKRGDADWRYRVDEADALPKGWQAVGFDDKGWKTGACPFGFSKNPRVKLPEKVTALPGRVSAAFRKPFDLPTGLKPAEYDVRLKVAATSFAEVYLNGTRIDRPPVSHGYGYWNRFVRVDSKHLRPTGNVLAAFVSNRPRSAVFFDVELALEKKSDALPPVVEKYGKPLFVFVQFSDSHTGSRKPTEGNNVYLTQAIQQVNALKPAFVLFTGDLASNGQEYQFEVVKQLMSACKAPVHYLAGNHDVDREPIEVYGKYFGKPYYAFTHGDCRFICLQTPVFKKHNGGLDPKQKAWLKDELSRAADATHVVVAGHHTLASLKEPTDHRREVADLLRGQKVTAYLCGHRHLQRPPEEYGMTSLVCPSVSAWNWNPDQKGLYPLGYRVCYVYADRFVSEYRYLDGGADDRYRFVIANPRVTQVK